MQPDRPEATQAPRPSGAELRAAPRISLMLRAAKLLCQSGEYVCIVRDVSTTGTKLRLFHAPPPDTHMLLELANGERYPMEMVWAHEDHAGFRFASQIDVDAFMEERSPHPRRPIRLRMQLPARVKAAGIVSEAVLINMSQQGACIEAGSQLPRHELLRVDIEGLPPRFGHVCWRSGHKHGLVFQQAYRLDELAQYALALQPYGAGTPATARSA